MIPKTIFQTYGCEYNELPDYIKNCTETWQALNPDFNYVYMSERQCYEYILNSYGQNHADVYNSIKHKAMKGDWWRYLIVNKMGGLYMDIDTVCRKPISSELDLSHDFITTMDFVPDAMFIQWGFGSTPDNPILNNLIKYILDNYAEYPSNKEIIKTDLTGPLAFQKAIISVLKHSVDPLLEIAGARKDSDKDYLNENINNVLNAINNFNNDPEVIKHKFYLYFWTFNNIARHFGATWRWSDNTVHTTAVDDLLGHVCKNESFEYADIKIKLKNGSYSSYGWSK